MMLAGFFERLGQWNVIVALAVAVTAFVVMLVTKKLVARLWPDRPEEARLKLELRVKIVCAVLAVAACILAVAF